MKYSATPKRKKSSKLRQRRLKSKLESKQIKNEQARNRKMKQINMIYTNEMYPKCKPLLDQEIELITKTIMNAKIDELEVSDNLGKEFDDGYI